MQMQPPDNEGALGFSLSDSSSVAVITWVDDVLYPVHRYRESVCRVGARLFRLLTGCDASRLLHECYTPGHEASVVRNVLKQQGRAVDERMVRKISEAMILHQPSIPLYEDAVETFGLLQAMQVPVGLIGEGNRRALESLVKRLGAEKLFRQIIYSDPSKEGYHWQDAMLLLEVACGIQPESAVIVSTDPIRTRTMTELGWTVCFLDRESIAPDISLPAEVVSMVNLYQLPEALGLIAWDPPSEFRL